MTHRVIDPTVRVMEIDLAIAFVSASAIGVSLVLALAGGTSRRLRAAPRSSTFGG